MQTVANNDSSHCVFNCACFLFLRVKREYETSRVEQLVSGADPDCRPLLVHQPVFYAHGCDPATGGSAASGVPRLHAPQQTQPAPQRRFVCPSSLLHPFLPFTRCGISVRARALDCEHNYYVSCFLCLIIAKHL